MEDREEGECRETFRWHCQNLKVDWIGKITGPEVFFWEM